MRVKLTVVKDDGKEVTFSRELNALDSSNILTSIEGAVGAFQSELSPFLSETLIEDHQQGFVGKKNQEEKWDK